MKLDLNDQNKLSGKLLVHLTSVATNNNKNTVTLKEIDKGIEFIKDGYLKGVSDGV